MKEKSGPGEAPAEQAMKDIRRQTRRQYSAEEKIRIVLEGVVRSYAGFWVTGRSGGVVCRHVDDLDTIVESDTCDHLRQLICAFEPPPVF